MLLFFSCLVDMVLHQVYLQVMLSFLLVNGSSCAVESFVVNRGRDRQLDSGSSLSCHHGIRLVCPAVRTARRKLNKFIKS